GRLRLWSRARGLARASGDELDGRRRVPGTPRRTGSAPQPDRRHDMVSRTRACAQRAERGDVGARGGQPARRDDRRRRGDRDPSAALTRLARLLTRLARLTVDAHEVVALRAHAAIGETLLGGERRRWIRPPAVAGTVPTRTIPAGPPRAIHRPPCLR